MKHFQLLSTGFFIIVFLALGLGTSSTTDDRTATLFPSSFPQPNANDSWMPTGTPIISDFDGDHRSDLAFGRTEGNTYRVEIRLSNRREKTSIALISNEPGINLFACDVDRDNDQDLVVSSALSRYPLAVWLSDGNGHFQEGNRWLYVDLLVKDNSSGYGQNNFQPDQISISQDERSPFDSPFVNFEEARSEEDGITAGLQVPPSSILTYSLAPRSPPFYSVL
jgi:hypothetical protein